jgi:hypothetical protein
MGRSEEELRMLDEERREKRADNSGGYFDPYPDDDYPVNVETPSRPVKRRVEALPRSRNRPSGTVPSTESKVLRILGVADDSSVHETLLEPNEALERIKALKEERNRQKLGGQAVQESVDSHPSGEGLPQVD